MESVTSSFRGSKPLRAESEIQGIARKLNLLDEKIDDVGNLLRKRVSRDTEIRRLHCSDASDTCAVTEEFNEEDEKIIRGGGGGKCPRPHRGDQTSSGLGLAATVSGCAPDFPFCRWDVVSFQNRFTTANVGVAWRSNYRHDFESVPLPRSIARCEKARIRSSTYTHRMTGLRTLDRVTVSSCSSGSQPSATLEQGQHDASQHDADTPEDLIAPAPF